MLGSNLNHRMMFVLFLFVIVPGQRFIAHLGLCPLQPIQAAGNPRPVRYAVSFAKAEAQ